VTDWADWLVTHGQADAAAVAEAERVLEAASLQPGDTVLDVGAGLGLLTLAAHERIGDGWVIAVDPSVGALEELLRLAHDVGSNGIMYLVGDAEILPLPDASVDAAILRSVLGHVADVSVAITELARVLRPGGRLSLCEPLTDDGAADLSALDPDRLVLQLEKAGFTAVERSDGGPPLFLSARRP
jgi:ubiquinone/menaquinone biosynthesis C-methylase UbiE